MEGKSYRFEVRTGKAPDKTVVDAGTKLGRGANFRCLLSSSPIAPDYIRKEAQAGRMGARLMAIAAEGDRGRVYVTPTEDHAAIAKKAVPKWKPEQLVTTPCHDVDRLPMYGMYTWGDAFTPRQLVALTTFSDLVAEACTQLHADALNAGLPDDSTPLRDGGSGVKAYAEAVGVYLGMGVSRLANRSSTICFWDTQGEKVQQVFARQAIPMTWDFVEGNPLSASTGNFYGQLEYLTKVLEVSLPGFPQGVAYQADAAGLTSCPYEVISTDPPYYDNIGYADLSDFFYVWLRRCLHQVFPSLFTTLLVPKTEELVATPYRHGSRDIAEEFFLAGMTRAIYSMSQCAHPAYPVTIYYAFKQSETKRELKASTGWETFLEAVIKAGFVLTGTWPLRTELIGNLKKKINALATSIILVGRPRPAHAPVTSRRDFLTALKREMPSALRHLQQGNIAPVDLAQASIGPGMAIFTRYARILESDGTPMRVRTALALINQTLDEVLAEQEGDFDADTGWAVAWFDRFGFNDGPFGDAETLCKAKNTAIGGLQEAGIALARAGKVRLLWVDELPADWDPLADQRLTVWESVHHLIRTLNEGETAAAALVAKLGGQAEAARELAYRLYNICERRKRAQEAQAYNGLVLSWLEIVRLAQETRGTEQASLF